MSPRPADGVTTAPERWFAVADLHLEALADEHSDGFAAFLRDLVEEARKAPVGLLLLGDVLELLERPGDGPPGSAARRAVRRLTTVLHAHPDVVRGLRTLTAAGATVVVVPGNHDADLLRPEVGQALVDAVGPVRVEPWFFAVPGLFLAEHGHQHHEVNRFPRVLDPVRPDGSLHAPCAPRLDVVLRPGSRSRGAALLHAVAGLLASTARLPRDAEYRALLAARARETGLPVAVLADLHDASRPGVLGAFVRPVLRRLRRQDRHAYLRRGVHRVADVLDRHGVDAPFLLAGHVHAVADEPVGAARRYLNTGTWSHRTRPGTAARPFPYLELRAGPEPSAAVRHRPVTTGTPDGRPPHGGWPGQPFDRRPLEVTNATQSHHYCQSP